MGRVIGNYQEKYRRYNERRRGERQTTTTQRGAITIPREAGLILT